MQLPTCFFPTSSSFAPQTCCEAPASIAVASKLLVGACLLEFLQVYFCCTWWLWLARLRMGLLVLEVGLIDILGHDPESCGLPQMNDHSLGQLEESSRQMSPSLLHNLVDRLVLHHGKRSYIERSANCCGSQCCCGWAELICCHLLQRKG